MEARKKGRRQSTQACSANVRRRGGEYYYGVSEHRVLDQAVSAESRRPSSPSTRWAATRRRRIVAGALLAHRDGLGTIVLSAIARASTLLRANAGRDRHSAGHADGCTGVRRRAQAAGTVAR